METKIGIYDSHRMALEAIEVLTNKGFPDKKLKLIGQADIVDDHIKVKSNEPLKNIGIAVGIVIGTILGLLSGMNYFPIPGFGFIFGTGALVGALIGFDLGLVAGGIVSLLITLFLQKDKIVKYREHLKEGKFLVFAEGTAEEIKKAKIILCGCGTNLELCLH
jgi:uncharacterized membrane protein